jgi:hypothetical protein
VKSTPEILADLKAAFPRQELDQATVRVYVKHLSDLSATYVEQACEGLIQTSEWFPTIRAIREATAELMLSLPSEAEALAQLDARIEWARTGKQGDEPEVHPLVHRCLQYTGGWHGFREAERPGAVRAQFTRLYQDVRTAEVRSIQVGKPLLTLPLSVA